MNRRTSTTVRSTSPPLQTKISPISNSCSFRLEGSDESGNRNFRIVGMYFPVITDTPTAPVVSGDQPNKYIFQKICTELPEGPFCIVYMHSAVQKEDNSPGLTILRWIYEELPLEINDRLQVVHFIHPGLRSR